MPFFSVILATRDRPALFAEALRSVLAQDFADLEIIVVNDGSREEHRAAYDATLAEARDAGRFLQAHWLVHRPRGHGPAYSRNFGVEHAAGHYLCFLDDDDLWTDPAHLRRAWEALQPGSADLYLANQSVYRRGEPVAGPAWLDPLRAQQPAPGGAAVAIDVEALIGTGSFCHMNTFIIRAALFRRLGGMDESIRWEEDRDLYLRAIDAAQRILYARQIVARHNAPDATANSASVSLTALDRWLHQLRVLDKASLFARHPAIRAHGRQHKVYALKRIAEDLYRTGRWTDAAFYAREALWIGLNLKWFAFAAYLTFGAFLSPHQRVSEP